MEVTVGDFTWLVHGEGYKISLESSSKNKNAQKGERLVPVRAGDEKLYQPLLEYPALFLTFACLPRGVVSIRRFADLCGLLEEPRQPITLPPRCLKGEMIHTWELQIERFSRVVFAWVALRLSGQNTKAPGQEPSLPLPSDVVQRIMVGKTENWLEQVLHSLCAAYPATLITNPGWALWRDYFLGTPPDYSKPSITGSNACESQLEWLIRGQPFPLVGDDFGNAAALLGDVNMEDPVPKQFMRWLSPRCVAVAEFIRRCLESHLDRLFFRRLVPAQTQGLFRMEIKPRNLLNALWLQLFVAVQENKNYRACKECGKWFEASLDPQRTKQQYCSNTCRLRAHRKKPALIVEAYKNGTPLNDIAQEHEMEVDRIILVLREAGILAVDLDDPE
jgi:hypothetical protein